MHALPFNAANFFVLRSPSLPFDTLNAWQGNPEKEALNVGEEVDQEWFLDRLRTVFSRVELREALYVASPELEASLDPWLQGKLPKDRSRRMTQALLRYLIRMSSRSTPFGLFAGCAVGNWGDTSKLSVPALGACRRHTRLDADFVAALVASLDQKPEVRAIQTLRPNSSLHPAAGRWHYAQARVGADKGREYDLVALEPSRHLQTALDQSQDGAQRLKLAEVIAEAEAVDLDDALSFVDELVEAQVLVSDLQPPLTGGEPLPALIGKLTSLPIGTPLAELQQGLTALDAIGVGHLAEDYRSLTRNLEGYAVPFHAQHLFQVDLHKPSPDLSLGPGVRRAFEEAVELLRTLTPPPADNELNRFKEAFKDRYDTRQVPLLEVLDAEVGLGFGQPPEAGQDGSPLLEGLPMGNDGSQGPRMFTDRDLFLMNKLQGLAKSQVWSLSSHDLAVLTNPKAPPSPDSFTALVSLAATSSQALDRGDFMVVMERYSGPSGAQFLGRFCQGDPDMDRQVKGFLKDEENLRPDVVFAEIVHQPEGRLGNILARPNLRPFEIPYLGVSGTPEPFQILPQDLMVSLEGERLVLRSLRLGCEVIPRLATAHNHSLGMAVYRFLAQLQGQDGQAGGWTWGALSDLAFLPRVTCGRHVLARARWRIEGQEIKPILSDADPVAAFKAFRAARALPQHVVLEDADQTLWVDQDEPWRVKALLQLVSQRHYFSLVEAFPGPEDLVVEGPDGHYCHELIIPFQRRSTIVQKKLSAPPPPMCDALRTFPPGSEWLYCKIYGGPASSDRLLVDTLAPLIEATSDLWDQWFFIRYADPSPHLRLRFHGDPDRLAGILLPLLHRKLAPALAAGHCWRIQIDTYEREVERYGGPNGIILAESWFQLDSQRVLEILRKCPGDVGAQRRWRYALTSIDFLLTGLGFDLATKAAIVDRTRTALRREFQNEVGLDRQLGDRYRNLRSDLEGFFPLPGNKSEDFTDGLACRQTASLRSLADANRQGRLSLPLEELAGSLLHMHVNRLLRSSHRAHEFVLTDFLGRAYRSQSARSSLSPCPSKFTVLTA